MINRRVKLTKKLIKEATLELLEKKPLNKITITDICKTADVNRSTFYSYYQNIIELVKEIEDDILKQLPNITALPTNKKAYLEILEDFFFYVKENYRIFKILIIQNNNSEFSKRLIETVIKNYPCYNNNKVIEKYNYIYCISGVIGLIKEWISSDFNISVSEFSELVFDISSKIIEINNNNI